LLARGAGVSHACCRGHDGSLALIGRCGGPEPRMTSDSCEVAIVGGGPAGLAAAAAMKACGLDVCLIDEQPRLGGQIYRQPPEGFRVDSWLTGRVYRRGKALLERVERLADLRRVAPATVWGLFPA